jgi:hypothetical protein
MTEKTTTTTKTPLKIAAVTVLLAALTFIAAASIFSASITEVHAARGEAALHISPQGAANQSPQGAASSGICSLCT